MAEFREKKMTRLSAYCKLCKHEIESRFTHDFVSCKCGNIMLDGGPNGYYYRILGDVKFKNSVWTSRYREMTDSEVIEDAAAEARRYKTYGWEPDKDTQHSDLWWSAYYSEREAE